MRTTFTLFRNILIPIVLAVVLLGALFLGVIFLVSRATSYLDPLEAIGLRLTLALRSGELEQPAGTDPALVCFQILQGETATGIAEKLRAQGFDLDPDLFRAYVRYFNIDAGLQAGTFLLSRTFTIPQIAAKLQNAGADSLTFRTIEGWRIEEIAAAIDSSLAGTTITSGDFRRLVGGSGAAESSIIAEFYQRAGIPAGRSLEGFLFPDTYALPACGTALDLVIRMLQNFDVRVTAQMRADAKTAQLTLYEAVTLAAIVQREAVLDEERALIAGVYLNRLANARSATPSATVPRTLDADPTIQYALGNSRDPRTWWPPLTQADYRGVSSAFNTYLNPGLPPAPICSPGLASLRGAIYPQQSAYIYFRACAGEGGRHRFSTSFAEHQAACP